MIRKNLTNFLVHLVKDGNCNSTLEDEIIAALARRAWIEIVNRDVREFFACPRCFTNAGES